MKNSHLGLSFNLTYPCNEIPSFCTLIHLKSCIFNTVTQYVFTVNKASLFIIIDFANICCVYMLSFFGAAIVSFHMIINVPHMLLFHATTMQQGLMNIFLLFMSLDTILEICGWHVL